ncbi:MAG: hypothetical protein ABJA16_05410 [Nakamurella sp.]
MAVLALFAFDGFVFGTWAARVPDISLHLGLSAAALGGVLLCVSIGALPTMQLAGRWCARYGAGRSESPPGSCSAWRWCCRDWPTRRWNWPARWGSSKPRPVP